jgi:hypothetical protein
MAMPVEVFAGTAEVTSSSATHKLTEGQATTFSSPGGDAPIGKVCFCQVEPPLVVVNAPTPTITQSDVDGQEMPKLTPMLTSIED